MFYQGWNVTVAFVQNPAQFLRQFGRRASSEICNPHEVDTLKKCGLVVSSYAGCTDIRPNFSAKHIMRKGTKYFVSLAILPVAQDLNQRSATVLAHVLRNLGSNGNMRVAGV